MKTSINEFEFAAVGSKIKTMEVNNETVLNVVKKSDIEAFDEPTYAKLVGVEFRNGLIEVKVLSKLLEDAPLFARGFIGIAFRINEDDTQFESIYIRPTNGRTDDMARANHAVQYFAYPDYKFDYLREHEYGTYESGADIGLNEWIDLKIEVKDASAKLFINNETEPVLTVEPLKLEQSFGSIALWCDVGTDAYFKDLRIVNLD